MGNITVLIKNCTLFCTACLPSQLTFFIFAFSFFCWGCQTTQYHQPILLTQEEIKTMIIHDANGMSMKMAPGKIKDCVTMNAAGAKDCAYILCKEDKPQITGLSCEYYIPVTALPDTMSRERSVLAVNKNSELQTQIKSFVKNYENGKTQDLEVFCGRDTVVCYFKAKPFPSNKKPSMATLATLVHKESVLIKNTDSLEISVFKD